MNVECKRKIGTPFSFDCPSHIMTAPRSYSCQELSDEQHVEATSRLQSLDCWCSDLDRCLCAEENDKDRKIGFDAILLKIFENIDFFFFL